MGGGGLIIGGGDCGQSQTLDLALVVGSESVIGFRVYIGVLYVYIYIWIMEKKMETAIIGSYKLLQLLGLGLYGENGTENGNSYLGFRIVGVRWPS